MARIIIAEDDPISVYLVRSALEDRGHIVGVLPDGSRVLDVATTKRPDLLILDASMPLKGGLDALREVRRNDEDLAYRAGADDYLRKPFDPDELAVRVETLLEQGARRQAAV